MVDRPWKRAERQAAALFGGRRYPANTGGCVDEEGPTMIAQVKHRRTLSLGALEGFAVEAAEAGRPRKARSPGGEAAGRPGPTDPPASWS